MGGVSLYKQLQSKVLGFVCTVVLQATTGYLSRKWVVSSLHSNLKCLLCVVYSKPPLFPKAQPAVPSHGQPTCSTKPWTTNLQYKPTTTLQPKPPHTKTNLKNMVASQRKSISPSLPVFLGSGYCYCWLMSVSMCYLVQWVCVVRSCLSKVYDYSGNVLTTRAALVGVGGGGGGGYGRNSRWFSVLPIATRLEQTRMT